MRKSNIYYLTFLLLFSSVIAFGQTKLTDEEQKQKSEAAIFQHALDNDNYIPSINTSITPSSTTKSLIIDQDDDGMDDDWETANELDPNDPKDAWHDADNDHILNLFEYQLETDPNSSSSPSVTELGPAEGVSAIDDLVTAAEGSIQVIRLSQGQYDGEVLKVYDLDFKLMIQGGWNDDFTEYNPKLYPTNWHGNGDEALTILHLNDTNSTKCSAIIEGINFSAIDHFSLSGALNISSHVGESAISIYNCDFTSCTYYGLSLFHKGDVNGRVFIANTLVGNNTKGGIYLQVTENAAVDWQILNTTINNPASPEGGIDGFTLDQASIRYHLKNCIIWGNMAPALNFSFWHDFIATTMNSTIENIDPSLDVTDLGNTLNLDPVFVDPSASDWSLGAGSPCIDTGIDIGLVYNDAAPDMGARETPGVSSSLVEEKHFVQLATFPNPFSDQLSMDLEEVIGQEVAIKIYDMSGNKLSATKQLVRGKLHLDTKKLSKGIYILQILAEEKQYQAKVIKM